MSSAVYLITNLVNGKLYVGKTNDVTRRWTQHLSAARETRPRMVVSRALQKYGHLNFTIETLESFETEDEALWWEGWYIEYLGSHRPYAGYNVDSGGVGGKSLSASTKQKLSVANRGRKRSAETLEKMSRANRGKRLSPETRAKMSTARLGKKRDARIGVKVAETLRGRTLSAEVRANMSAAHKGKNPSPECTAAALLANQGRPCSPETKAKIAEALRGNKNGCKGVG